MHFFSDEHEDLARAVIDYALMRLRLDPVPLGHPMTAEELQAAVGETITADGLGGAKALQLFDDVLSNACISVDHPRYLSFIPAAPTEAATMFDLVVGASSLYGGSWLEGSGAVFAENQALSWLATLAGMPESAAGVFMQGGTVGNLTALVAARDTAARERGERPTRWRVACSSEVHSSIDQAARVMDVDVLEVPVGDDGRLTGDALRTALVSDGAGVFAVVATAGTTNVGIIDDLASIAEVAEEFGLWLHVDGAWGGPVVFSPKLRAQYLPLLEQADSFTLDFHKMPGTALMCNVLLMRGNSSELRQALSAGDESYIFREGEDGSVRDLGTLSLQCGRRVDSLKWFLDWKFYGPAGLARRVEQYLELCAYAEAQIQQHEELEMVVPRESFNVCFRYRAPVGVDPARLNTAIRERMQRQGRYLVGTGFVKGELALRLLVTNTQVGRPEIDDFLATVVRSGQETLTAGA